LPLLGRPADSDAVAGVKAAHYPFEFETDERRGVVKFSHEKGATIEEEEEYEEEGE
jgi:hypothetical protein